MHGLADARTPEPVLGLIPVHSDIQRISRHMQPFGGHIRTLNGYRPGNASVM